MAKRVMFCGSAIAMSPSADTRVGDLGALVMLFQTERLRSSGRAEFERPRHEANVFGKWSVPRAAYSPSRFELLLHRGGRQAVAGAAIDDSLKGCLPSQTPSR
jgi:hypothetical protein